MAEFRLLGPVGIWADGRLLGPEQPRQRQVLAALLVDAGRSVSAATLIDRIWGHQPPREARTALRAHVSRVRRAIADALATGSLAGGALVRSGGGYLMEVDADLVDLHRLRGLARRAAPTNDAGVRLLREAVGLWRGEPLAGVKGEWAARMRTTWQQERLDVAVAWARAELEAGNAAAVIAPLADLTGEHPLVESIAVAFVRALHAVGRTADAIDRYSTIRTRLAEELGVGPGAELQAAYQTLLRGDTTLARAAPAVRPAGPGHPAGAGHPAAGGHPVPAQLPADVHGFAGRTPHLDRLDAHLARSSEEPTALTIVVITGTPGVGKTTLAVHWGHRVAHRFADGQLYLNLRGFGPDGQLMGPAEAVRRLLDALHVPRHLIPADPDAQAALYRSELAGRRMLLLLDNARDTAQVRPLLPGNPGCLVVVTSRNQLASLVADGAHPVALDLFTAGEAEQLMNRRLGATRVARERRAVEEIINRCARLPLALAIVAARAAINTGFPLAALAGELGRVDDRLEALTGDDPQTHPRAVFSWSYRTLSPPAARLFRLLGLYPGPDIAAPAAASLAGLSQPEVRTLLAELGRASLLTEYAPGRYGYHDLLRAYAVDLSRRTDPDPQRRAAVGRVLDHYLHTAYTADRLLYPARDPIALTPALPGVTPVDLPNRQAAIDWFTVEYPALRAAIEHAATTGFDVHTWQLAWTMRTYLVRRARWHAMADVGQAAVDAARRLADHAVEARARHTLGSAYIRLGRFGDAQVQLIRALDLFGRAGDLAGQAKAHHHLAHLWERQDIPGRSLDHSRRALALYAAAGHLNGQAQALNGVGWYSALLGDYEQGLASCQRALELFRELGDAQGQANTWDSLGYANHHLGRHAEAVDCYQHALHLFRSLGTLYSEADTLTHLGDTHDAAGDPDAAGDAWQRALNILDALRHPDIDEVRSRLARQP